MKRLKIRDNKINWFKEHYKELGFGCNRHGLSDEESVYYKGLDYATEYNDEFDVSLLVNYVGHKVPYEIVIWTFNDNCHGVTDFSYQLTVLYDLFEKDLVEVVDDDR